MEEFAAKVKRYDKVAVAALHWLDRLAVCVDDKDNQIDYPYKGGEWKPVWKILGWWSYTTRTFVDHHREISEFNFSVGGFGNLTTALANHLFEVWFGFVRDKYHKVDNKTALKIQNRLTKQVVYLGWYDGKFTVTELEPEPDPDFPVSYHEFEKEASY